MLLDQGSIKNIRFSLHKDFWIEHDFHGSLEERVFGTFRQWGSIAELKPYIDWDDGGVDTTLTMHDLLPPSLGLKLEKYADNRAPRKASKRRLAGVVPVPEPGRREFVDIAYKEGGHELKQRWFYEIPEAIQIDERQAHRQKPEINRDRSLWNTPVKMWANVALSSPFIKKMFGDTGFINQRLDGASTAFDHRKTNENEGVRFCAYMLAIANNPGVPVRRMWAEQWKPGEKHVMPPPGLGRYGMSENRFFLLAKLLALMHSLSESELDASDPWRYCNLVPDSHNDHWEDVLSPSWLLAPDESMCPETKEGDKPTELPFLSNVPRKPKPLG